ncbi:aldehyde dehydrogenase family protein [bacterium]|nr:aldehyde dehydrogenase family protein [bacterium]
MGELAQEFFPPGVVNVVSGGNELGAWMTEHPGIRKIAFTGSGPTGKRIMASAAGSLKRITLELGGNDAGIVLDDVDAAKIAGDLFWAKFSNCGQVCAALKRMFVQRGVYQNVCDELVKFAKTVKMGPGTEDGMDVGPIQNRAQYLLVNAMVQEALAGGATILYQSPGRCAAHGQPERIRARWLGVGERHGARHGCCAQARIGGCLGQPAPGHGA